MPAFIASQPPTVPGMPAPNSSPEKPRRMQKRVDLAVRDARLGAQRAARSLLEPAEAPELDHDALERGRRARAC